MFPGWDYVPDIRGFWTLNTDGFLSFRSQALAQLGAAFSLILLSRCETFPPALFFMAFAIGMTGFFNAGPMVLPQDMAPDYAGSVAGFSNTVSTFSGKSKAACNSC